MKKYKVALSRIYNVKIRARSAGAAKELAEYYVGTPHDLSASVHRRAYHFSIDDIEMITNDAIEVSPRR